MELIASTGQLGIRRIEAVDLPTISKFIYSVSIVEPHDDLSRLHEMFAETGFWTELAGAVAFVELASNRMVGTCHFYRSAPCIHGLEMGYVVHSPADRGKRYASQGLRLLSDYLFANRPAIYRHQLLIEVWNTASWRLAERAGFVREGMLRSAGFSSGDPADCFVYSRTHKDYHEERQSINGAGSNEGGL